MSPIASSTTDLPLNCRPKREMMTESSPRCCPCRCKINIWLRFSPIFWEVLVRKSRERAEKGRKTFKSRGVQLEKIIYKWVSSKPWWHRYIKMAGGTSMGFWGTLPGTLPTGWASEILHQMMAYPVIIPFTVFHIITNRYPAWCRISPPSVCSNQPFFPMLFSCAGWGPWQLDLAGPTQGWSKLIIRQTY